MSGTYTLKPGQGWYLVSRDSDPAPLSKPERVVDCPALDRAFLRSDYIKRKQKARYPGSPADSPEVGFVRCDDGIAWVNDTDEYGNATKGPWQRFVIDKDTKDFRPMCKGDDPAWQSRRNSPTHSAKSSIAESRSRNHSENNLMMLSKNAQSMQQPRGRPRSNELKVDGGRSGPSSRAASPTANHGRNLSVNSIGHASSAKPSRPTSMRVNSSSKVTTPSPLTSPGLTYDGIEDEAEQSRQSKELRKKLEIAQSEARKK